MVPPRACSSQRSLEAACGLPADRRVQPFCFELRVRNVVAIDNHERRGRTAAALVYQAEPASPCQHRSRL